MSGRVAVMYSGDLAEVADAFAAGAAHVATQVRMARLADNDDATGGPQMRADLALLEWADGIAFGTPGNEIGPAPELMRFLDSSEPLWKNGRLYDKAVTVFTDHPEHMAPDSILHPIYDALYRWGAVIVGPRDFDLSLGIGAATEGSAVSDARLKAAQYRGHRLTRLASVLAEERRRGESLQL
ncbi:MAG: flavodoxin family protein [Acidimicrobiales bacterium]